ncbi:DNA sulfur modification protein DndD [uncultured Draconibacterium sp.]|uniref:DNA sulfur modification protein DndD n=1 Tax=uncultured Draconibacterium sp. TaxID=1573823 RepID=UPI0025F7457C|nr:DNA sulfur modification protein DndD [uncultured Draconibacterium sp.]
MIIKEIELNNFRIYKGKNKVQLATNDDKNIIIVSGKNGFGKTTFLMSLVWCLYGRQMEDVDDLYSKEIRDNGGYPKYIANSLNRKAKNEGETQFSVSVTFQEVVIPEVQCTELKITRTYSTARVTTPEKVEILIDGYDNELTQEVGSEIFIREFIMPTEIAKFFFFDAEKIVSLAEINTAEQRRSLSLAYSEVLGIKKYEDMKAELIGVQKKLRADSAGAEEKAQLTHLKADVEEFEAKIDENKTTIKDLDEQISEKKYESNQIQEKLIKSGSTITVEELNELRKKESELNSIIFEVSEQLKHSYEIIPLAIVGNLLNDVRDQVEEEFKLSTAQFDQEKVQRVTKDVINDLISHKKPDNLIIDYEVQEYYVKTIKGLIKKHFFSDTIDIPIDYKEIHSFSEVERNELNETINQLKLSFNENFKRISGEYNKSKNELNAVKKRIRDAEENQENPIIQADRERKEKLDKEIESHFMEIGKLKQENEDLSTEITKQKKAIDKITERIKVSKRNEKKYKVTERLIKNLQKFISNFKEEKKKSLEKQILEGLHTLMHKKGFVNKVDVQIIGEDIDINLIDSRGDYINKGNLSKGEQQMYATALLKGLVEESYIKFPVFIDSPMQKFDIDHAHNIVKYFYPEVSDQVVLFPLIKKEMSLEEYELLIPHVSNAYLLDNKNNDSTEFKHVKAETLFSEFDKLNANAV